MKTKPTEPVFSVTASDLATALRIGASSAAHDQRTIAKDLLHLAESERCRRLGLPIRQLVL